MKLAELLSHLPGLKDLNLSSCPNINDKLIAQLNHASCQLETLSISNCRKFTDQGIHGLLASKLCQTLVHLNVSNTLVSDATVAAILDSHLSLRSLIVSFCNEIANPFDLVSMSRQLAIAHLDMSVTRLSDQTVKNACRMCPNLSQLNVSGPVDPTALTDDCVPCMDHIHHFTAFGLAHCSSIHFSALTSLFRTGKMDILVSLDLSALVNVDCILLVKHCNSLQVLILEECRNVVCIPGDQNLSLMTNKRLHHLSLKSAFFSDNFDINGPQQLAHC